MKKKNRFWICTLIAITLILNIISSCKKEEEKTLPSVTTNNVNGLTSHTATCGGNVTSDGNATITERGICYSTTTNPTIANSKIIAAGTTGIFISNLTDLTAGTTYYVRAYATNSLGIVYGNEVTFTTLPIVLSTITTTNITTITATTAQSGGSITSDGNSTITERGICYSTATNPTIANSKIIAAGTMGIFTSNLTDLTAGTKYYVRAYAINSVGIAYGNEVTFTTLTIVLPTITTTNVTTITTTTAKSGGNITSDGNATIIERGICFGTTASPTIANSKIVVAGTVGVFTSNLTDLTAGTKYYVRAYAINSIGTAYGNEISFTTYNADAISDVDNNYYNIITIGPQKWLKENLKTTKYCDGSTINNITDNISWTSQTDGAFCWYNNDAVNNKTTYGALYNYYAVVDNRKLCPTGWHVPSDAEWSQLTSYIGDFTVEDWSTVGTKLKATNGWNGNGNGTDIFGFSALPGGSRGSATYNGTFMGIGDNGMWWSSTEYSINNAYFRSMSYDNGSVNRLVPGKDSGFSIRCVKDN